jgi:FkbM family methyltransferase
MMGALRPGDLAVDVGAHKGGYTYSMRRAVGATGAVVACEPQPELADYLRTCVGAFDWRNVAVVERALSCSPGTAALRRPGAEPSPAASLDGASFPAGALGREVEVDTLDGALAALHSGRPLRFLKCDVEGHELEVFKGGVRTLTEDRPLILVECEARHAPERRVEDVFMHLTRLGFEGSFFLRGERHAVADFDVATHQIARRRPYVNNFLFQPVE